MSGLKTAGVYTLDCFGDGVVAAFSGREFPRDKWPEFLQELDLSPSDLITLRQIHSSNLILVKETNRPSEECPADGLLTKTPGVILGIRTADCIPVFFWDPEHKSIALVHAGWRGIYYGINQKTVQAFRQNLLAKPKNIQVALGPCIRKCCYEVGSEFKEFFPKHYEAIEPESSDLAGKAHVDLVGALKAELILEGVEPDHIHDSGYCTACQNDAFFSYRKEKETPERILSIIALRR